MEGRPFLDDSVKEEPAFPKLKRDSAPGKSFSPGAQAFALLNALDSQNLVMEMSPGKPERTIQRLKSLLREK
jgi:hypothetical protein